MSRRRMLAGLCGGLMVAGLLGGAVPGAADDGGREAAPSPGPTWGPTTRLGAVAGSFSLAVDGRGVTTIVWGNHIKGRLTGAQRDASGDWSPWVRLGRGVNPQVAADAIGNATVVWQVPREGLTPAVVAARVRPDGSWTSPVQLSPDLSPERGKGASSASLAVARNGAAVVVWRWQLNGRPAHIQAVFRPVGGPWSRPVLVGPLDRHLSGAAVGMDAAGNVTLAYERGFVARSLWSARRLVGQGWTESTRVLGVAGNWSLAVNPRGNAAIATTDGSVVYVVRRGTDGHWGTRRPISRAGVTIEYLTAAALTASGTVVLGWYRYDGGREGGKVFMSESPLTGPQPDPTLLAGPVFVYGLASAANASGDRIVVWGSYPLLGRYRPQGGAWSRTMTIAPDPGADVLEGVRAVVLPDGGVVVAWKQEARALKVRVMSP